jgi:hypothetical protein
MYVAWWKKGAEIINHPDRWQVVQDPNDIEETVKLDLRQAWSVVRKHIGHLPKKEQDKLKRKWVKIQRLKAQKGVLKKKWEKTGKSVSAREVLVTRQGELIEMFGKFKSIDEVLDIVRSWGYDVSRKQIHNFSVQHKEKIGLLRDEWSATYEDFSLAKKRGRLEKLSYLARTQLDRYKKSNYAVTHSREIRSILESIKKEIEGERIVLDIKGNIDPTLTIEANKTLQQILRRVSLTSLVVSIVAAKRNIDPQQITAQLQKSVYAKFSGAIQGSSGFSVYESKPDRVVSEYDWITIEKKHSQDVEYEEINMEVPTAEKEALEERRMTIVKLLERQKRSHDKLKKKT